MKYPYIGYSKISKSTYVFYSNGHGTCLKAGHSSGKLGAYSERIYESSFHDVTREYLKSHAIKIESQEHLDFLYKVVEGHELNLEPLECRIFDLNYPYFVLMGDNVIHIGEKHSILENKTLTTIPLPPKEPKHKEWPQVGDEVIVDHWEEGKGIVIALHNYLAWVKHSGGCYLGTLDISDLKKPLTPEGELAEKLRQKLKDELDLYISRHDPHDTKIDLTDAILNGEIEGLSYKPE